MAGLLAARSTEARHDGTRSVADVLADHVVFEMDTIDRMFFNVYVPGLQYPARLVAYVHRQLELRVPRPRRRRQPVRGSPRRCLVRPVVAFAEHLWSLPPRGITGGLAVAG